MTATVATTPLREYLTNVARIMGAERTRPDLRYSSYEQLVLERGRSWDAAPLPRGIRRGAMKNCYENSTDLVLRKGYRYVEGYALPNGLIPVMHAWCVDDEDRVVDPTWKHADAEYIGMEFSRTQLSYALASNGVYGILPNDYRLDCPLLRTGTVFIPDSDAR